MGDAFERVGYNQLNHKLKITGGGLEVSGGLNVNNGNISGSITSTGSFGAVYVEGMANSNLVDVSSSYSTRVSTIEGTGTTQGVGTTDDVTFANITSTGDIIAENYIISSSVTYMTSSFASGSTIFGNSNDDTHTFTGSLFITGSRIDLDDGNNNTEELTI